ncbi:ACT domain-containing protein [Haloferax sp. Atlit-6N]|uniref:ACT domain-containing protein n=1 Tax=unclassified Haloferax TaxID=2625095 RepID=UPI000E22FC57|nr:MULTISPECIES: ACT domain-containing protein [unclassified Haloferax]RDZ53188.1 ACT domain-containing protein [Haloferax sp. Atlit-4N]REA02267.1 ACT domain-containing protein [Haloferax sp. Atlit-6N]
MDPSDFFEGGTVTVSAATYAVVKAERGDPDAFATIRDENETTVVVEEGRVDEATAVEVERGWKRLTFEMVLPFELVGFLAQVAGALAEEDISIFALSAYSTDHVLVREDNAAAAATKLESLGCTVEHAGSSGDEN